MDNALTGLERSVLSLIAKMNWPGFRVDAVEVVRREHTGVGRFTYLHDTAQQLVEGVLVGADYHFVDMEGIPNGLFFHVAVDESHVSYIEMATAGGDPWDGVERAWTMR